MSLESPLIYRTERGTNLDPKLSAVQMTTNLNLVSRLPLLSLISRASSSTVFEWPGGIPYRNTRCFICILCPTSVKIEIGIHLSMFRTSQKFISRSQWQNHFWCKTYQVLSNNFSSDSKKHNYKHSPNLITSLSIVLECPHQLSR